MIQPGGTCMQTTHAMDLLLQKLPPDVCMAHCLSGLFNNLLSIAVLCDVGCKVYFHSTSCKVSLNRKIILHEWRDPKNQLWQVKIINDGWITNLKTKDNDTTCETPIDHTVAEASSLYECNKIYQLINFYHATLNYPVVST